MVYSEKTLQKTVNRLQRKVDYFMKKPFEKLKIHVSKGNSKIGHTHNFSLAPVITCANCAQCKKICYDVKACFMYKNVMTARAENTAMVLKDLYGTFAQIASYIEHRKRNFFFRFHVAGEIISTEYFDCMVKLAKMFPNWRFWTYTKVYWIVNHWIDQNGMPPKNLVVMFSVWEGVKCYNPYNLPTFSCIPEDKPIPEDVMLCPGNCDQCIKAKTGCVYGQSAATRPH